MIREQEGFGSANITEKELASALEEWIETYYEYSSENQEMPLFPFFVQLKGFMREMERGSE